MPETGVKFSKLKLHHNLLRPTNLLFKCSTYYAVNVQSYSTDHYRHLYIPVITESGEVLVKMHF